MNIGSVQYGYHTHKNTPTTMFTYELHCSSVFIIVSVFDIVNKKVSKNDIFVVLHKNGGSILDTLTIIQNIMAEKGISQKELCDRLGQGKNTFSHWKSGRTNSYMKRLPEIAEILGVSVDYLVGKEKSPAGAELSEKEAELVTILRAMNDNQFDKLLDFAKYLLQNQ